MVSKNLKTATKFNLNLPSGWLPKGWDEVSRDGNEIMVTLKLSHLDPENQANPLLISGNPTAQVNGETVSVHGIAPRGTMTKFFDSMTAMAATGWMKGYTPEKITEIRGKFNQMQDEKYDSTYYISICRYPDEIQAKQALQNQIDIHTTGLDYGNLFKNLQNPEVLKHLTLEQRKNMDLLTSQTKNIKIPTSSSSPEIKYFMDKYAGYPAVYCEMANPEYLRFMAPKPKIKPRDPNQFQGGGFDPLAGKGLLPKRPKLTPPPKIFKGCLAFKMDEYVISGTLISAIDYLPKGNTFHESLTKTKTYIETEKVEGQTYTTKHLLPVASTYASEGYVYQEQAEEIVKKIINSIIK